MKRKRRQKGKGKRMGMRKERRKEQTERLVVGEEMGSDCAGQVDE